MRTTPVAVKGLAGVLALSAGGSHSLAVTGPVAAYLAFRTPPAPGPGGTLATQPVIEVRDGGPKGGSIVESLNGGPVTIFVKPGTGESGSYLTGETAAVCRGGVAAFAGLGLSHPGRGYVLRAVFPGLPPVDSQPFNVPGGTYGWADVAGVLRVAGGLGAATGWDVTYRNPEAPADRVDLRDALRLARKVAGLEPNP